MEENQEGEWDQYVAMVTKLFENGYTEQVKSYTSAIRHDAEQAFEFAAAFDFLANDELIDTHHMAGYDDLLHRVDASQSDMEKFLKDSPRSYETYLKLHSHENQIKIDIGWIDDLVGAVLWDQWTESNDDPVMALASISFLFDEVDYLSNASFNESPEPPLYRYHPERYRANRNYADVVAKEYIRDVNFKSGLLTVDQLNTVIGPMMQDLNLRSSEFPRRKKDAYPKPSFVIDSEQSLVTAYGRFVQAGKQIMDFPPLLTGMLSKTDIDDIPLNSINLPYSSQYLYFGPQPDMEIDDGWFVDGAYVEQRGEKGDIRFTVTAVPTDRSLSKIWFVHPEPQYTQDFVENYRTMDLGTAIDIVLSDKLASLNSVLTSNKNATSRFNNVFTAMQGDSPQIVNIGPEMDLIRDEIVRKRHPIYKSAIQLVVNALCYVASYPEDIKSVWPEKTPETLKRKALNGKPKEQQRAKSKLAALGYVPVHLCGQRIEEQISITSGPSERSEMKSTHWRRGHWRSQAFGPGRSLRKLIWLMPMLIGSQNGADPDFGHLYLVT